MTFYSLDNAASRAAALKSAASTAALKSAASTAALKSAASTLRHGLQFTWSSQMAQRFHHGTAGAAPTLSCTVSASGLWACHTVADSVYTKWASRTPVLEWYSRQGWVYRDRQESGGLCVHVLMHPMACDSTSLCISHNLQRLAALRGCHPGQAGALGADLMGCIHSQQHQRLHPNQCCTQGRRPLSNADSPRAMLPIGPLYGMGMSVGLAVSGILPVTAMQPAPVQSAILHLTMKVRSCMGLALPGKIVP